MDINSDDWPIMRQRLDKRNALGVPDDTSSVSASRYNHRKFTADFNASDLVSVAIKNSNEFDLNHFLVNSVCDELSKKQTVTWQVVPFQGCPV